MEQREAVKKVTDRVIRQLTQAGHTRSWLCSVTGIPRVTLDHRLSGQSPLTLNELDRIAEALSVPTADLLPAV